MGFAVRPKHFLGVARLLVETRFEALERCFTAVLARISTGYAPECELSIEAW